MTDCGFDWEADGRFSGAWRLTGPDGQDVEIPVLRIKSGDGPSLYINAGTHGDEFEGQIALRKVWAALSTQDIRGSLTMTPSLNLPATLADQRRTPGEDSDLNRSFPGGPNGNFAERLADIVCRTCVVRADAVMDLHAGGSDVNFHPFVIMHLPDSYATAESYHASVAAAEAFGVDYILHTDELDKGGMLDTYVEQLGKPFVCFELGGAATTTPRTNECAETGVWRLLKHFGVLKDGVRELDAPSTNRHFDAIDETMLFSPQDGLFETIRHVGDCVLEGDVLGYLYDVHDPTKEPAVVTAPADGMCIVLRARTRVSAEDFLGALAKERVRP